MLKAATNCWGRFRWAWPARGGLPAIVHPAVHLLDSHLTLDLQHLPLERLQSLAINMLQVELTDDAQSVLQALAPLAARLGQVGLTLAA
eukprot:CAMPEP_0202857472 /NCGR_PEP_ID=MMETSP1391-20130828/398_1 /ASSEMBLY_ACC=CAM_ASM_000867 /TAXON_ID=1034604 /ORGANISM="Chlamydomonas leiostraca, Strain SAG 11-49" /LENGTH=88 /DNA_ID=CAMNT_0049536273 /DNA_START=524 /DNA_END=787 /DNA_ORIENTATION=-